MQTARDVMERGVIVAPELPVKELAQQLHDHNADGACVVDGDGRLLGVVTNMDLVFKEKRLHLPTVFFFLDAIIPLEFPGRTQREMEKIAANTARDLMTSAPYVALPDAPVDSVASLMVDHHASIVPVVDDGRLLGVVTKSGILRTAFGLRDGPA